MLNNGPSISFNRIFLFYFPHFVISVVIAQFETLTARNSQPKLFSSAPNAVKPEDCINSKVENGQEIVMNNKFSFQSTL